MPYNKSNIGQFTGVNPAASTRNSFKVFDAQEVEIGAIDFERLGINTIHPKDRTTITELEYADVRSVAGEISPGREIQLSATGDTGGLDEISMAFLPETSLSIGRFNSAYVNAMYPRRIQTEEVDGDVTGALMPVLPKEIRIPIRLRSNQLSGIRMWIPIIPEIGFMNLTTLRKEKGYDDDPGVPSDARVHMPVTTLNFGVSWIGDEKLTPELDTFYQSATTVVPDTNPFSPDDYVAITSRTVSMSRPLISTAESYDMKLNVRQGPFVWIGGPSQYPADILANGGIDLACKIRKANAFKVVCTPSAYPLDSVVGYVVYSISSLGPGAQNATDMRHSYPEYESYTPMFGREYFVAIPDRIELLYVTNVSSSVSREENAIFIPNAFMGNIDTIKKKRLATFDNESVCALFLITHLAGEPWENPKYLDHDEPEMPGKRTVCVLALEQEDGTLLIPEDIEDGLVLSTGEPIGQTVTCIESSRRDVTAVETSYALVLCYRGQEVAVSLTKSSAKAVSPLSYGVRSDVLDIPLLKMVILNSDKPLPVKTVDATSQRDVSLHFHNKQWTRVAPENTYDWTWSYKVNGPGIKVQKWLDRPHLPPTLRKHGVNIYYGNLDAISNQIKASIDVAYGAAVPVFTDKLAMLGHAEYQGIACEHYPVMVIPILFPQLVALKIDAQARILYPQTWHHDSSGGISYTDGFILHTPTLYFEQGKLGLGDVYPFSEVVPDNTYRWDWIQATAQDRLGFHLADIWRHGTTPPWANLKSFNVPGVYDHIVITGETHTGSVLLISPPALTESGTPETVLFAKDTIGCEFSNNKIVYSTRIMAIQSTEYLATRTRLYNASYLYPLTTTKDNYVTKLPHASGGYLGAGQFVFVRMDHVTHVYVMGENETICMGSVIGQVAPDPIFTASGLLFASVESTKIVLYALQQNTIMPIKNIPAESAAACLNHSAGLGTALYIVHNRQLAIYLIDGPIVTMNNVSPGIVGITVSRNDMSSSTLITKNNGSVYTAIESIQDTNYSLRSSEFYFPLIDGYKTILSGIKLSFDYDSSATFDLKVYVNDTCVLFKDGIACDVECIERFKFEFPVGCARYEISNCSGTLRNVAWLIYPLPLLAETIEQYVPDPPVPQIEIEEDEDGDGIIVTLVAPEDIGNFQIDVGFDGNYLNCLSGYRCKRVPAGSDDPVDDMLTTVINIPVTAPGQTIHVRAACLENDVAGSFAEDSVVMTGIVLDTPTLVFSRATNVRSIITVRNSGNTAVYSDNIDYFELELYTPEDDTTPVTWVLTETLNEPVAEIYIPHILLNSATVLVKCRAVLGSFKSAYSNALTLFFGNLDIAHPYDIAITPDTDSAEVTWKTSALYDTFTLLLMEKGNIVAQYKNIATNSYSLTGLKPNTDYGLAIYAIYKDREGVKSQVIEFATLEVDELTVTVTAMGGNIALIECEEIVGAVTYEFSIMKGAVVIETANAKQPSYMFTNESSGTYTVTITATYEDDSVIESSPTNFTLSGTFVELDIDEVNSYCIYDEETLAGKIEAVWTAADQYNKHGAQLLYYGVDLAYYDGIEWIDIINAIVGVRATSYYQELDSISHVELINITVTAVYADENNHSDTYEINLIPPAE